MKKSKAIIITGLIFVLLCVLAADVVAVIPESLPWILGVLAVPGAWLFCKALYSWLTTDSDAGIKIYWPPRHKKKFNWEKLWAGKEQE